MVILRIKTWSALFFIAFFLVVACNSKSRNSPTEEKVETSMPIPVKGFEVISKLASLRFFSLTPKEELDGLKNKMIENYDKRKFFNGVTFNDSLRFVDHRFYFVDCEELFESGGLIYYLNEVKPTFDKLGIVIDFQNEVSQIEGDYWKHTIEINDVEYLAYDGAMEGQNAWGVSFVNFVAMLNDVLMQNDTQERVYPISCGNDGKIVFLTTDMFKFVKTVYPVSEEHPEKLYSWKQLNGLY